MLWEKIKIKTEAGELVDAQAPIIISASRATDIPAFYSEWFFHRLKKGYLAWKNPFNGKKLYVSFEKTRLIVFWSKNPKPIFKYLDYLDDIGINYYFQFTLNDYEKENLERKVPNLNRRIETFIELSERIGKEKVIWRFDPYFLMENLTIEELLERTKNIGDKLKDYTEKLVFSFADIKIYKKVLINLKKENVRFKEFSPSDMRILAKGLSKINSDWGLELATCSEVENLSEYGIKHNKCIDDDLMVRLFPHDKELMKFIGYDSSKQQQLNLFDFSKNGVLYKYKVQKDKGQRPECGCIPSKDIGQYNTCPHECLYCYAVSSIEKAKLNYKKHKSNPFAETITGE